eukprot:TRINITY_DN4497_c1_g1_i1.p1 TRINITY_DN4497_c1_g1~~TRINITY_DN4497_c1_g1_i1.p1  ORF type:complete len:238 (+),score=66.96 TRINITY_DN4497_c1_g1_i1:55-768(+)
MGVADEGAPAPAAPAVVDRSDVGESEAPSADPPASPTALDPAVTVMVSGLSGNVTEQMVSDFMVFCGEVSSITIKPDKETDGRFYAIVVFGCQYAVDDALMLSGAIVGDSQVSIATVKIVDNTPDTLDRVTDRATTATETATKVIEAGYIKGEALASQLKVKAKQYDEKYEVSARSKGVVKTVSSVVTGAGNKVKSVVGGVAGKKDARGPTEEEQRQFQDGGVRSWDQKAVSSQPQW